MNLSSLKSSRVVNRLVFGVMVIAAVGFVVGPMLRGRTQRAREALSPEQEQQLSTLQQEAADLRRKIGAAEQTALQKNPTLAARHRELTGVIDTKLRAEGVDPAQLESSMKQLQVRIRDARLPETQRKKAATEAMELMQTLATARNRVLADPAVASRLTSFRREVLAAMKKDDPSIAKVIQQLEETEAKLEALQPPT